jgi:transposase
LGEAVERCVSVHRAALSDPDARQQPEPLEVPQPPARIRDPDQQFSRFRDRAYERHAQVHALLGTGRSMRQIARELGMKNSTVRKYAAATDPAELLVGLVNRTRNSPLDPFKPYLHQRLAEGCTKGAALHRELAALGYTGSYGAVRDYLQHRRPELAKIPDPPPPVRTATAWIMSSPDWLDENDQVRLKTILARSPELDMLAGHVRDFAKMMVNLDGYLLDDWIIAARASGLPPLTSFARGLLADHDAVRNGLTLPWSSGACEGNVNRIKMIKRQMYGRANLDLLRIRVIHDH